MTHYTLLGITPTAAAEEVKRAFRREVARYHPDKVQHLGPEFQELATWRSSALTEAYRVLIDGELRRQYDEQLARTPDPQRRPDLQVGRAASDPQRRPDLQVGRAEIKPDSRPQGPSSLDLVRRAVLMRIRDAAAAQGGVLLSATGFDALYGLKGRTSLFRAGEPPVRVAARIVPTVDVAALEAAWPAALRCRSEGEDVCLLLLGSGVAPPRDLGAAVSALRRRSRGPAPVVVPVDIRDWQALFPPETPPCVRALLARVRNDN